MLYQFYRAKFYEISFLKTVHKNKSHTNVTEASYLGEKVPVCISHSAVSDSVTP